MDHPLTSLLPYQADTRPEARGMSEGGQGGPLEAVARVRGRSGTGAPLTPERPVLEESMPSPWRLWKIDSVAVAVG